VSRPSAGAGKRPNPSLVPFYARLGPEFDVFVRRGTTLIYRPIGQIMGGIAFQSCSWDKTVRYIAEFVQPLYVPRDYEFPFGHRIPEKSGWGHVLGDADLIGETIRVLREEGLPQVLSRLEPDKFYEYLLSWLPIDARNVSPSHWYEALAWTATLLGEPKDALRHIDDALKDLVIHFQDLDSPSPDMEDWESQQVARFRLMRNYLESGDLEAANAQLVIWQRFTVEALGIDDLLAPPANA
jgi:hypothetical protein